MSNAVRNEYVHCTSYMCTFVHVYMHVCVGVYVRVCVHACVCVGVYVSVGIHCTTYSVRRTVCVQIVRDIK